MYIDGFIQQAVSTSTILGLDVKSPKVGPKSPIMKDSMKIATSNTCVSDLIKERDKSINSTIWSQNFKIFVFLVLYIYLSLVLFGEYTNDERSKDCFHKVSDL